MNEHLEASFKKLSEQFLTKISEEKSKWDERQLNAINGTLREWSSRIQQQGGSGGGRGSSEDRRGGENEHDLLRHALAEAKERQGKIIGVLVHVI